MSVISSETGSLSDGRRWNSTSLLWPSSPTGSPINSKLTGFPNPPGRERSRKSLWPQRAHLLLELVQPLPHDVEPLHDGLPVTPRLPVLQIRRRVWNIGLEPAEL